MASSAAQLTWMVMYEAYWGLTDKPFENTPDPRFLFHSEELRDLYTRLLYTLQSRHGAAMLTGDSGCGKTMVARSLLHELDASRTEIALMSNPCRDGDQFLNEILYQLGDDLPTEPDRQRTVHRIHEIVYDAHSQGKETIVVVDEAQLLQEDSIFEEMRLLLNLQLDDAFLITLLLVGQGALGERIRKHGGLDQRIATRGVVRPFHIEDTRQYIDFRLTTAGRQEPIFHPEAIDLIHEYTSGVPRKINNICDIALVIGFSRKLDSIDADWAQRLIEAERGDGS
ncbi:MAG: AAA family ATPase [Gemmatimonadetes bacterium]|nr:AAA family ATPase [Gemmatimonadota bacterium]MBT6146060.1 AAA family ATPase [Gemmatimonadota bacterium]MBT7858692.1 AAA family ATPase [Gemmatimonadota bacterium]